MHAKVIVLSLRIVALYKKSLNGNNARGVVEQDGSHHDKFKFVIDGKRTVFVLFK